MARYLAILQWILYLAISAHGFLYDYRRRRSTSAFGVCSTWVLMALVVWAFAIYGGSLVGPERERWGNVFPSGPVLLFFLFFGWGYGLILALAATLTQRIREGSLLL